MKSLDRICLLMAFTLVGCNTFELMELQSVETYPLEVRSVPHEQELKSEAYQKNTPAVLRSFRYCFAQLDSRRPKRPSKFWEIDQEIIIDNFIEALDSLHLNIDLSKGALLIEQSLCPDAKNLRDRSLSKRYSYSSTQVELEKNAQVSDQYLIDVFFWHTLLWLEETDTSDLVPGLNQLTGELRFNRDLYLIAIVSYDGEIVYRNAKTAFDRQLVKEGESPELGIPPAFIRELVSKTMDEFESRRQ